MLSLANDVAKAFMSSFVIVTFEEAVLGVGFESIMGIDDEYEDAGFVIVFFCKEVGKLNLGLSLLIDMFKLLRFVNGEMSLCAVSIFIENGFSLELFMLNAGAFLCAFSLTEAYGLLTLNALSI